MSQLRVNSPPVSDCSEITRTYRKKWKRHMRTIYFWNFYFWFRIRAVIARMNGANALPCVNFGLFTKARSRIVATPFICIVLLRSRAESENSTTAEKQKCSEKKRQPNTLRDVTAKRNWTEPSVVLPSEENAVLPNFSWESNHCNFLHIIKACIRSDMCSQIRS